MELVGHPLGLSPPIPRTAADGDNPEQPPNNAWGCNRRRLLCRSLQGTGLHRSLSLLVYKEQQRPFGEWGRQGGKKKIIPAVLGKLLVSKRGFMYCPWRHTGCDIYCSCFADILYCWFRCHHQTATYHLVTHSVLEERWQRQFVTFL